MSAKYLPGWVSTLALLGSVPLFVLVAVPWMQAENAAADRRRAAELAELTAQEARAEAALTASFRKAFADGDRAALIEFCRGHIHQATPRWQAPVALAFHPQRIDAFFRYSLRRDRLDRYGCTPDGVVHERVPWPRALAVDLERDGMPEAGAGDAPHAPWEMLAMLAAAAADEAAVQRIELLADPEHPVPLQRWHAADGTVLRQEPADADEFAGLSALAADASPAQAPQDLLQRPMATLAMLAVALPSASLVHRVELEHEALTVTYSAEGQRRQRQLDRFGDPIGNSVVASSARDCEPGLDTQALQRAFLATCADSQRHPGCHPDRALDHARYGCAVEGVDDGWWIDPAGD